MDEEMTGLSTIIIDSNGNPIGQVIYRCALCRKICDSSNDALIHYQVDHIEMTKLQISQQPVASSAHALSQNSRNVSNLSQQNQHHLRQQEHANTNQRQSQQQSSNSSSSPSTSSNSLLKRDSSNSRSLLKRVSSSSASNSLLKGASGLVRNCQIPNTGSNTKGPIRRLNANSAASSLSSATAAATAAAAAAVATSEVVDTIQRQYTTTSASRAAKRHCNSANSSQTGSTRTESSSMEPTKLDLASKTYSLRPRSLGGRRPRVA